MKYIATAQLDTVLMVDDSGQLLWAINPVCPGWSAYEQWQALPGSVLLPVQPSEFHTFDNGAWQIDIEMARKSLQARNRAACKVHILEHYPAEIQLSMNAGMYNAEAVTAYQDFLAATIAEENRVFDWLEAAADPTTVAIPNWPEA